MPDEFDEIFGEKAPTIIACNRARTASMPPFIKIEPAGSSYLVRFPYNPQAVALLKRDIRPEHRKWSGADKGWFIHPDAIEPACLALEAVFGGRVKRPTPIDQRTPVIDQRRIRLEYLGVCKQRSGSQQQSAYGFANGEWSIEIPEKVLRAFFGGGGDSTQSTNEAPTLYRALLLEETADAATIKSAYRRLARQWHPDVCREEEAPERFREISEAYQILNDSLTRKKYDAGLYFERQQSQGKRDHLSHWSVNFDSNGYRAPLRCGLITAKGQDHVGRFVVSEILGWEDLTNERGEIAVSTWPVGAKTFSILWV
jgi:hypothetical protein